MVHDGRPLHESGTICEYLDESYPDPPLRPAAPYDRALMRNWVRHIDGRIHDLIVFNWRHAFGDMASKWTDAELGAVLARIPSEERRQSWLRVARRPYTEEERAEARGRLVALLGRMEAALAPSGWLVGDAYSIADIAAVPFVKRIEEEIAPDQVAPGKHPLVAEWWSRVQARPAFARADIGPFTERPVAS
jgi:glutathione S-transferase